MSTMLKFFRKNRSHTPTSDVPAVEETGGGVPYIHSPTPAESPRTQAKPSLFSAFKHQFSLTQRRAFFRDGVNSDSKSESGSYATGWQLQDSYSGASDGSSSSGGRPSISHDTSIDSDSSSMITPRGRETDANSSLSSPGRNDFSLSRSESCSSSVVSSPVLPSRRKLTHTKSSASTASSTINCAVKPNKSTPNNDVLHNSSRRYIRNDNATVIAKNKLPQMGDPRLLNQSFDSMNRKHSLASNEVNGNIEGTLKTTLSEGQLSQPVPPPRRSRNPHQTRNEKHASAVINISSKHRGRDSGVFSDNNLPLSKSLPTNDEVNSSERALTETNGDSVFTNGFHSDALLADSGLEKSYDSMSDWGDMEWKRMSLDLTSSFCSTLEPTESLTSSLSSASSSRTAVGDDAIQLDGNENYVLSRIDNRFFADETEGDTGTVIRKGRRITDEVSPIEISSTDNKNDKDSDSKVRKIQPVTTIAAAELASFKTVSNGNGYSDRSFIDDASINNREASDQSHRSLQLSADSIVNAAVMKSILDDRHVIIGDNELSPKLTRNDNLRLSQETYFGSVSHEPIIKSSVPSSRKTEQNIILADEIGIIKSTSADHNFETNGKLDSKSFLNGFLVNGFMKNHSRNSSIDSSLGEELLPNRRTIVPVSKVSGIVVSSAPLGSSSPRSQIRSTALESKDMKPQTSKKPHIAEKPLAHTSQQNGLSIITNSGSHDVEKKPMNGFFIPSATNGNERTKDVTVFHSLNGDASKSVVSVSESYTTENIIYCVLEKENFPPSCHLYRLIAKSVDPRVESDNLVEFDEKDHPLKRQHRNNRGGNIRYELEQKSGVEIKIMCKVGTEKPRRKIFAVPFSATCVDVVHSAIKLFNLSDSLPDSFCLFQIDKDTKDSRRVMNTDIVSELGTDSFLLCEKEHLAKRDGGDDLNMSTPRESPPNMSRSSSGFFPFTPTSQTTIQLQTRLQKVEADLDENRRASELKIKNLESNVEYFQAIAACTDPESRFVEIERALEKLTNSVHDHEKLVRFIQAQMNVCRKSSQPNHEKYTDLSVQLESAQSELRLSNKHLQTVSDWLDEARKPQKLSPTRTNTKLSNTFSYSLYDIIEECKPCIIQSVELTPKQSASRALLTGRDDNGRVVVMSSQQEDLLDQGDRILEINDHLVYNLRDEDVESVIKTTRDRLKVVVLKESWLQLSSSES